MSFLHIFIGLNIYEYGQLEIEIIWLVSLVVHWQPFYCYRVNFYEIIAYDSGHNFWINTSILHQILVRDRKLCFEIFYSFLSNLRVFVVIYIQ